MANNDKQTELNKMRRSFSWDRAFFTSDGFLAPEELLSMIEGGGNDVKHELDSMEAKLFQELEASTKKYASSVTSSSINLSSEKRDSNVKKVIRAGDPYNDATMKTAPKKSSPLSGSSGGSPGNNVKILVRKGMSSKDGKANADSPSETPPAITTKSKVGLVNTRVPRTSPASPVSPGSKNVKADVGSPLKTPLVIITKNKVGSVNTGVSRVSPASPVSPGSSGSSSSTFSVNQRPKWNGSVRCGSLVNNEKPVATNGRRNDDWKSSKPAVDLMPKSQSSISSKIKPPPVISHTSSPPRVFNTCSGSTESSSSSTKPSSKKHPTGSTNGSNARKLPSIKTVATANTGLKPKSPKTTTKKQSSSMETIPVISPEILDLKGKINALKMEINIQKDRCNKMVRVESSKAICC